MEVLGAEHKGSPYLVFQQQYPLFRDWIVDYLAALYQIQLFSESN
jgi:hypothetical protein